MFKISQTEILKVYRRMFKEMAFAGYRMETNGVAVLQLMRLDS